MKTEIVYDGVVAERRYTILKNLASIASDESLQKSIDVASERLNTKNEYKAVIEANEIKSRVYFDIMLGDYFYDIVTVGNYGMSVFGEVHNPLFAGFDKIIQLEKPHDLLEIKQPLISLGKTSESYAEFVSDNMSDATLINVVGDSVTIDVDVFAGTALWHELEMKRSMLSEKLKIEPHMVFSILDVTSLLSMIPSEPSQALPILPEYQKLIIDTWKRYLLQGE